MLSATGGAASDVIVPMVIDLVRPGTVIDIGCGAGAWLATFKACGVTDVLGVDDLRGDRRTMLVDRGEFVPHDLATPFILDRRYDLAVSVEVAEHLSSARAPVFIQELVHLSDVVLFSAAIPYQGGKNHINEQWPDYWAALFKEHGFIPIDCLRERLWSNPAVLWWYAQNLLFYVRETSLDRYPALKELRKPGDPVPSLVHPDLWDKKVGRRKRRKARILSWFRL